MIAYRCMIITVCENKENAVELVERDTLLRIRNRERTCAIQQRSEVCTSTEEW
jgi:hypothetical protein